MSPRSVWLVQSLGPGALHWTLTQRVDWLQAHLHVFREDKYATTNPALQHRLECYTNPPHHTSIPRAIAPRTSTTMNLLYYSLAVYLSLTSPVLAAASKDSKDGEKPCTITSPTSGSFFDLSSLQLLDPKVSKTKHPREHSWNATGYDLGYNFTVNVCGPVIENVEDVVGVEKNLWQNVSAYYKHDGKTYSLG